MTVRSEQGSALIESLPVLGLLMLFTIGILLAAYLFFARASIQYHSEQALYCAAEGKPALLCRTQLETKLRGLLPWGESSTNIQSWNDEWSVEVQWKYRDFGFRLMKRLSSKQILKTKALQW